jgi:hypothetical protein
VVLCDHLNEVVVQKKMSMDLAVFYWIFFNKKSNNSLQLFNSQVLLL